MAAVAAVVVAGLVTAAVLWWTGGDETPAAAPVATGRVTANGHGLFIACQGTGSPAVILDAGLGDTRGAWRRVLGSGGAADLGTRVCAYDRWGVGGSEATDGRIRPIADATADLHALLAAAGVPPPYVLVGHSIAGLIHRYYTRLHPTEVAGLVMLDTAPDDWDLYNKTSEFTGGGESLDIATVAAALRASDDLGDRPVAVVQAARTSEISVAEGFPDYWRAAQRTLASRSTNSVFVVADSNHGIPSSQPKLVTGVIALVLDAARNGTRLPACAASPLPPLGATC